MPTQQHGVSLWQPAQGYSFSNEMHGMSKWEMRVQEGGGTILYANLIKIAQAKLKCQEYSYTHTSSFDFY